MAFSNISREQMPYKAPILGYDILVLIIIFFTVNYLLFKLIGRILKINTQTGNDPSKIVYMISFMIASILTFVFIHPFLEKIIL